MQSPLKSQLINAERCTQNFYHCFFFLVVLQFYTVFPPRCKQNVKQTNKQKTIKKSKVMKFWGFILCLLTLLVIPQCLVMVYKSDYFWWCCDRAE